MSCRSSTSALIMRARCPDQGTVLQVNPFHNENLAVLNYLDGGQNRAAQCQVLPAGNGAGNETKTLILLPNQTFGEGQREGQAACRSAAVRLPSWGPRLQGKASQARSRGVWVEGREIQGRRRGSGVRLEARHLTNTIKNEPLPRTPLGLCACVCA